MNYKKKVAHHLLLELRNSNTLPPFDKEGFDQCVKDNQTDFHEIKEAFK